MTRRRLGRYELVQLLGKGGGGEVWEAVLHGPAGFRRKVALKRLSATHRDPLLLEGLLHEARLGALVSHPNVVSTLELSQHDGEWFLVMDLVRGRTTSALRDELTAGAVLDVGVQVCQGLAHIHGLRDDDGTPLGLVHRDIKPANLIVDDTGLVRIVDLGIAKLVGEPDQPAGTPGYMAPEQLDGEEDHRADLFALGSTLIRLATGQRPLGRTLDHLPRLGNVDTRIDVPELRDALDEVVPGLSRVVLRAMRHDPAARWASAAEMGAALQQLFAGLDEPTRLARVVGSSEGGWTPTPSPTYRPRPELTGRTRELGTLGRHVTVPGVVVVKGPAGVGKTKLVDHLLMQQLSRPAVRCDATPAATLAGLCHVVADALGVSVGDDPLATLGVAMARETRLLLVLDNVEQVAEAATHALTHWRAAVPTATFVVTSRVALPVPDSLELRLGALPTTQAKALFVRRYGNDDLDEGLVEHIVRAVDRLPLAIELAAARARQTSPHAVLEALRLHSALVLEDGEGAGLRVSLQASWDLLDAQAHDAMARLSAYRGAFGVDDASAVLAGHADPVAVVHHLVDQSMLQVRDNRFRLLPSVRAFVRAQASAGALAAGHRLHGRRLARLGAAELTRFGQYGTDHQKAVVRCLDDLVTAHHRAAAEGRHEVTTATAIAGYIALMRVGPLELAESLLRTALATGHREHEVRRRLVMVLFNRGRLAEADALATEGLERATEPVDDARYRVVLGMVQCTAGSDGLPLLEEAWVVQKVAGDPGYAYTLGELGAHYMFANRLDDAHHHLLQAIEACQRVGDPDIAYHQGHLATLYGMQLDLDRAEPLFEETLANLAAEGRVRLCSSYRGNYAELLLFIGRLDKARDQALQAADEGRQLGRTTAVAGATAVLSHLDRLAGDVVVAAERARGVLAELGDSGNHNVRVDLLIALAAALHGLGRHERADEHLRAALDCTGWVFEVTRAHLVLQVARWAPLELRPATERWREGHGLPLSLFLGDLADAWWAARDGDTGRARQHVLTGRQRLRELHVAPTSLVRAELDALEASL